MNKGKKRKLFLIKNMGNLILNKIPEARNIIEESKRNEELDRN
jgi:hypothetical protein